MKLFLATFLLHLSVCSFSQTIEKVDGRYLSQGIIEFDTIDELQLFDRALLWATKTYRDSRDAIKLVDRGGPKLVIEGTLVTELYYRTGYMHHTLQLDFKPNRIRYIFSELSYIAPGGKDEVFLDAGMVMKGRIINALEKDLKFALKSLRVYIEDNTAPSNDW